MLETVKSNLFVIVWNILNYFILYLLIRIYVYSCDNLLNIINL